MRNQVSTLTRGDAASFSSGAWVTFPREGGYAVGVVDEIVSLTGEMHIHIRGVGEDRVDGGNIGFSAREQVVLKPEQFWVIGKEYQ